MKDLNLAVDEMFPEGAGYMDMEESGSATGMMMDIPTNEKHVHADFFNDFDDLFDEDNWAKRGGDAANTAK